MDSENSIIPLCLYSNERSSYIGLPEKINRDGKIAYNCPSHPKMKLITIFYAINPDVKPNPTYADLICVKNANGETVEVSTLYDPFNMDVKCTRFLAWLEQTPGTLRLHISKSGDNIYISPNQQAPPGYQPYAIPNLHVLYSPSDNPKFTFSNSFGKCIPNPNSNLTLGQCIVLYNKNITRPEYVGRYPNILTYLKVRYGDKTDVKIPAIVGVIAAAILSICLAILLARVRR